MALLGVGRSLESELSLSFESFTRLFHRTIPCLHAGQFPRYSEKMYLSLGTFLGRLTHFFSIGILQGVVEGLLPKGQIVTRGKK